MGVYIAVDIGGTRIRVAVYPKEGQTPLKHERIATRGQGTAIERLSQLIEKLWIPDEEVLGIGIAAPGPIDPRQGVIFSAPNIPGWENVPLAGIIQERFGAPTYLGNDANMAAVGEWRYGAGAGHHNMIYITISTGIGGGVILDDRLVLGEQGLAGELGHITVLPDGPMCGCGHRGHLEAIASGTGIARHVAEQLAAGRHSVLTLDPLPTSKDIALAAANGDDLCVEAMNRAGLFLGRAMADFLHIFNPTAIIIGGGVSRSGPSLFDPMREAIARHVISPQYLKGLVIATAALGDDAGLLGTLAMARLQHNERQLIPDD